MTSEPEQSPLRASERGRLPARFLGRPLCFRDDPQRCPPAPADALLFEDLLAVEYDIAPLDGADMLEEREVETSGFWVALADYARDLAGLPLVERAEILEAISAAMAPLLWEHLRRSRENSMSRARGVMKRTLTSILREVGG